MPFSIGDDVHVAALGKGIVREVLNRGRYRVELKGRSIVAGEEQLTALSARPGRGHAQSKASVHVPLRADVPTARDLHGMTVEEAISAIDTFISDALMAGHTEVRLVHGKSGGRIRAALHRRLQQLGVQSFRVDPGNAGVTIVRF
jgi:DNA mismatch repair protein MutS2